MALLFPHCTPKFCTSLPASRTTTLAAADRFSAPTHTGSPASQHIQHAWITIPRIQLSDHLPSQELSSNKTLDMDIGDEAYADAWKTGGPVWRVQSSSSNI
jgi:hypothetical protein